MSLGECRENISFKMSLLTVNAYALIRISVGRDYQTCNLILFSLIGIVVYISGVKVKTALLHLKPTEEVGSQGFSEKRRILEIWIQIPCIDIP